MRSLERNAGVSPLRCASVEMTAWVGVGSDHSRPGPRKKRKRAVTRAAAAAQAVLQVT